MRTRAIIIKKLDTREYDQLVTCYTEQFGKMTAVAKSVLKHSSTQAMQLDIGNLVEFELVSGKGTPIIAGAQTEDAYRATKASLPHTAAAAFFLEVIDVMAYENQEDPELWEFLTTTLGKLDKAREGDILPLFRERQGTFLDVLGYAMPPLQLEAGAVPLDILFEYTAGRRLNSLSFLYQTLAESHFTQ